MLQTPQLTQLLSQAIAGGWRVLHGTGGESAALCEAVESTSPLPSLFLTSLSSTLVQEPLLLSLLGLLPPLQLCNSLLIERAKNINSPIGLTNHQHVMAHLEHILSMHDIK